MSEMFSEVKRFSISETIVHQVKQLILKGQLLPGQKLPSERELAGQLGVGRSSVREATSALLALGIAEIKAGEGVFIRRDFPQSTLESFEWSSLMLNGHVNDFLETRLAVEVATAGLAAQRATPADRRLLKDLIAWMTLDIPLDEFVGYDIQFHLSLAQAAQNIVMYGVITGIQQLMRGSMLQVLQSKELRQTSMDQHRLICEAVQQGDITLAEQTMRAHLTKDVDYFRKKGVV